MGDFNLDIRILLVDNDEFFANTLRNSLEVRSNGTKFILNWKTSAYLDINDMYDVFIFDAQLFDFDKLSSLIKQAQKINENAKILIVGETIDGSLLKKLMRLGIKTFAEKTEEDLDVIFDEIQEEAETKYRVSRIKDGIELLSIEQKKMNAALRQF